MPTDPLNAPFAGRALHFVGIGGAGMSGLALVAQRARRERDGLDQAESSYCERLRAAGIEPAIGHDAANLPEGAEVVVSTAIPGRQPGARGRARGGRDDPPPQRPARRAVPDEADDRGGGHAREDHDRVDGRPGPDRDRPRAGVPDRRRAPARPARTPRWGAGEWAVIEADESDRSFLKLDREVAVSRTWSSTTTRPTAACPSSRRRSPSSRRRRRARARTGRRAARRRRSRHLRDRQRSLRAAT